MTEALVIPDSITPKVGWRAWKVIDDHISSPTYKEPWEPMVPHRASCRASYSLTVPHYYTRAYSGSYQDLKTGEYRVPLGMNVNQVITDPSAYPNLIVPRAIEAAPIVDIYEHKTSPCESCSCGIYAATNIDEARQYGDILGRVALWGTVVEHGEGYRGEYAYPQAFYVPDLKWPYYKAKLAKYGVPILRMSEIDRGPSDATDKTPVPNSTAMSALRWTARTLGLVGLVTVLMFGWYSVVQLMWWGATGETDARHVLSVLGVLSMLVVYAYAYVRHIPTLYAWDWRIR